MKIIRRITIEHDKHTDHRVYLADADGRVVSLDTADRLEDAEAISRAEAIVVADESEMPEEAITLGETLADTMAAMLVAHKGRGDVMSYASALSALDNSVGSIGIVKPTSEEEGEK